MVKKGGLAIGGEPHRPKPEDGARLTRREARDLLLPFRLERGGTDHQDALHTVAAGQKLASRNGLHRFTQAHLVGQERAFGESEMQHAFALVRQQRIVQQVEAGRSGLDLGEEARARLLA
jgi:hypothetical protein